MEIMKTENIVGICVETSINELTQSKEVFNYAILSINHYIVRIDVIEDGKRDRNNSASNCFPCHSRGCLSLLKAISLNAQLPNPRQDCTRSTPDGLGALWPPSIQSPLPS